ncbi:transcobalamin-2-like [Ylistrum balloti]|uniref:transcobalamin-2-like n=1 Tax=Ylistrum balloti TaxID=509963 RepID=UPI002905C152|nr:transcobalamin-2-like [Ylistrum balloti]
MIRLTSVLLALQIFGGAMSFTNRAGANRGHTLPFYRREHVIDLAAIQTGSYQLLRARTDWKWGPRTNAEAILGLTLANPRWFQKNNAATYISIQEMKMELLAQLSIDKRLTDERWSKGKLAQYVTALQLLCHNPSKFFRHNLLRRLTGHLTISVDDFRENRFALSWVVIALCNNNKKIDNTSLEIINDHPGEYKFGVDEASMLLMATTCLNETDAKSSAEQFIVDEMRANMSQYNEFTKGLVVQALTAAETEKVDDIIDIARSDLRGAIMGSTLLELPGAASIVLPALARKSYLDASKVVCPKKGKRVPKSAAKITVKIKVTDDIISNTTGTWKVKAMKGSNLLTALQDLQKQSRRFRFKSLQTSFGRSITSINGMTQDIANKIFWKVEDASGVPLTDGVSRTVPKNGDTFIFRLTKF